MFYMNKCAVNKRSLSKYFLSNYMPRGSAAFLAFTIVLLLFFAPFPTPFLALTAQARQLPNQKIAFFYKDRPFRETIIALCEHVEIKCLFTEKADTDMTYIIEVESLRWDTVFRSALNAYKFKYSWIADNTIKIYK